MQQTEEEVQATLIALLADMTADWGIEAENITRETRIAEDLEFTSVDIIHLVTSIEEQFNAPRMGFQDLLMQDGRYVDDLTVGQIVQFTHRQLVGS